MAIGTANARHRYRQTDSRLYLSGEPFTEAGDALLVEEGLSFNFSQRFRVKDRRLHRPSARLTWAKA